ncbi:MAG: FAD-dependent oxidoreductase [Candidatus Yanofskybacteria bacterium]|nr:FAD-dependent oxidoreductase [Candidatus Yanofskybacteria bacterium]
MNNTTTIYDVIIIGGGPAGVAAGVYAARKKLKTLFITDSFGGQSIVSDDIQNWIGDPHISGFNLAQKLETHIRSYPEIVEIKSPEKVVRVGAIACADSGRACDFEIETDQSNKYQGKALILASGARRRKLGISGEEQFDGKGIAYCSTCDAPLFPDKKVAVVGGGNAGLEAVQDLIPYASEIYLFNNSSQIKGDTATFEEIKKSNKFKGLILNAEILEIMGDKFVSGLKYRDKQTKEEKTIALDGVFVEIGSVPNSEIVKGLVELDQWGQVVIDPRHASTSHPGIFAAGDITNDPYKQNNISAGDAVKAALAAYNYLLQRQKQSPAAELL